jgi:succinate dehydrogenase / fumarate reductase membrane anchor subunit
MSARAGMRSPLGRAVGVGSAKEGVQHWWMQRVTAVALVPLTLWFVVALIAHIGARRAVVVAWLGSPFAAIAMVLLLIAVFYHMALGIEVVIEDYVHSERMKIPALILNRLAAIVLGAAGIFAVLRIALGS